MTDHLPWTCRSTFNEDLNAWDVGKVTNMEVRRRPRWEPEVLGGAVGGGGSFAMHTGAPTRRERAVVQRIFSDNHAFNQPVETWDVGKVTNMEVRRRPRWELEL